MIDWATKLPNFSYTCTASTITDTPNVVCQRVILHTMKTNMYLRGGTPHSNSTTAPKIIKNSGNLMM